MTSTNFTVSDLSLKETWELIKTFFFLSVVFSIFYGLIFVVGEVGASATEPLGPFLDLGWAQVVLYAFLLLLAAKFFVQIIGFLGQFFLDLLEAIRECSFVGRLGVVLLILGGMYSMVHYPLIFFGFFIPVLGVIEEYQNLKREKQEEPESDIFADLR